MKTQFLKKLIITVTTLLFVPFLSAKTQLKETPPVDSTKNLLVQLQDNFLELNKHKNSLIEENIFNQQTNKPSPKEIIKRFKELKSQAESNLKGAKGNDPDDMTLQVLIFKTLLKSISEIVSIELFNQIHKKNRFEIPQPIDIQSLWNFSIDLNSFYNMFTSLDQVPKETLISFVVQSYNSNPQIQISLNPKAYFELALEALGSRVNDKTYLETFKCVMGYRQIELIEKFSGFVGQKFNRVISDTGTFCLGLSPLQLFPKLTKPQVLGKEIQLDYSRSEAAARAILTKSFNGPSHYFPLQLNKALKDLIIYNPEKKTQWVPLKNAFHLVSLFPEDFNELPEEFNSSSSRISKKQLSEISYDINQSVNKFLQTVPEELFNIFNTEPLASNIKAFILEIESRTPIRSRGDDGIMGKLKKAESLFFYERLATTLATHPLNLSFMAFGDLDSTRKQVLMNIVMQSLYESKSDAFQYIFQYWLKDEMWSDATLPKLQNIISSAIEETIKRVNSPQDKEALIKWTQSSLEKFQKEFSSNEKGHFNHYIKDILIPSRDLFTLEKQPLEKLNIIYDSGAQQFGPRSLLRAYTPYLYISERVKDWMEIVFKEADFRSQKNKLLEVISTLKNTAPKKSSEDFADKVKSLFSSNKIANSPQFFNRYDENDFYVLNKLYFWLGYSDKLQPVTVEKIIPHLKKNLDQEDILSLLAVYKKELTYAYLSKPEHRLLDFPITFENKKQPLYMWLNNYNDVDSLGEQGKEWLKKVIEIVISNLSTTLKEINTKSIPDLSHILLYAQTFNLELGDQPLTPQRIQSVTDELQTFNAFDPKTAKVLQRLSMLSFHKKKQESLGFNNKRKEALYDEYYNKYHWQFNAILGVFFTKLIASNWQSSLVYRTLSQFTLANKSLVRGYWGVFTISAANDLYIRYRERQPAIHEERKHFEVLTYSDLVPANGYQSLMEHLDFQQELTDDAIFTDYLLLSMPIATVVGAKVFQKYFVNGSYKMKELRHSQGGSQFAKRNARDLKDIVQNMERDFFKNIDNFSALGINFEKSDDALALMHKLWDPRFLKNQITLLEKQNLNTSMATVAYRRIIVHIYESLSRFEQVPSLFSKYIERYLGKHGDEVYNLIKQEYSKITGVKL